MNNKKKMEFSKKMVVTAFILIFFCIAMSGILSFFDKEPLSNITMSVITCFGGFVCGGYYTLAGSRDNSKNKYGITELEYQSQKEGDSIG